MRSILFIALVICIVCSTAHYSIAQGTNESAGVTSGEFILDAVKFASDATISSKDAIIAFARGITVGPVTSTVQYTIDKQLAQKEQAESQMTPEISAQQNLANSKKNVATMFGFIVSTMIVLFDAIFSIIYILLVVVLIWIVFTGWVRFMVLIIDWIYGRMKSRGRV
jgi:hypothetical protein